MAIRSPDTAGGGTASVTTSPPSGPSFSPFLLWQRSSARYHQQFRRNDAAAETFALFFHDCDGGYVFDFSVAQKKGLPSLAHSKRDRSEKADQPRRGELSKSNALASVMHFLMADDATVGYPSFPGTLSKVAGISIHGLFDASLARLVALPGSYRVRHKGSRLRHLL